MLAARIVFLRLAEPELSMPPGLPMLPENVLLVTVNVPSLEMPPPQECMHRLPEKVLLIMASVPAFENGAGVVAARVAREGAVGNGQRPQKQGPRHSSVSLFHYDCVTVLCALVVDIAALRGADTQAIICRC